MSNIPKNIRVRIWGFVCAALLLILIIGSWLNAFRARDAKTDEETETSESSGKLMASEMQRTEMTPHADASQGPSLGELAKRNIRVLIRTSHFENPYHKELLVSADQKWYLEYGEDLEKREWHDAGETVLITEESDMFSAGNENACIQIGTMEAAGKVSLNNVKRDHGVAACRGTMEIRKRAEGMTVINSLGLEEYLLGVVPSEMPANYPVEALKAQAICARTYAVSHLLNPGYPEWDAHLDDSTAYQVYGNQPEQENASKAVKETEGMILLTMDGTLADTFYYSTSCGRGTDVRAWDDAEGEWTDYVTEDAGDPIFLLEEHPEDLEYELPWYRWTYEVRELDLKAFEVKLQNIVGSDESIVINEIWNLAVTGRAKGGAAKELTVVSDDGTYRIRGEKTIRELLCDGKTMVRRKDGSKETCVNLLPSAFFLMEIYKTDGLVAGYRLTGGGYGHGIGMSQNGAMEMALRGSDVKEILKYYYEDGILSKME